jgi:hypothetical protein
MATYRIPRRLVKHTLDTISQQPWRLFAARCIRRSPVFLRYCPINMTTNGAYVRKGDYCKIDGPDKGNPNIIWGANGHRYNLLDSSANRRPGEKIILQDAGDSRLVVVKNYDREAGNASCHARPVTGKGRNYDPLQHDLYPLAGVYNDAIKRQPNGEVRLGRFGQWRPYTQICMRGITSFRALGHRWIVTDPPTVDPICYPTVEEERFARIHVVTTSGMREETCGREVVGSPEAWETAMGLT